MLYVLNLLIFFKYISDMYDFTIKHFCVIQASYGLALDLLQLLTTSLNDRSINLINDMLNICSERVKPNESDLLFFNMLQISYDNNNFKVN